MKQLFSISLLLLVTTSKLLFSGSPSITPQSACEFVLIIPSFNNGKYYKENLDSACWQESTHPYHIYYINDCSTDATGTLVEAYIKEHHLEDTVTLIHNIVNIGGGANIYNTIHEYIEDHKVVVILDGDDLFPHNHVLKTLETYYENPNVWMTHGALRTFPKEKVLGQDIADDYFKNNDELRAHFEGRALRTFKAGLYKKIKKEDFLYKGEFMKVTWDLAFMLPMVEMCNEKGMGKKRCIFIPEVLYLYRTNSPINDFRVRSTLQTEVALHVKSLKPYEPITSLEAR